MPGKQDEKKPGAMATPAPSTFVAKTGSLAESAAAGSALTLVDGNAATAAASSWHWDEQDNESEGEYAEHPVAHGKQQKQVQARESFALDDSVDSVANAKSTASPYHVVTGDEESHGVGSPRSRHLRRVSKKARRTMLQWVTGAMLFAVFILAMLVMGGGGGGSGENDSGTVSDDAADPYFWDNISGGWFPDNEDATIVPPVDPVVLGTPQWNAVRLPAFITPSHYALALNVDMRGFTFDGTVVIDIALAKPSSVIVLHSVDLAVTVVTVVTSTGTSLMPRAIVANAAYEQLEVQMPRELAAGDYTLRVTFNGTMTENLRGFYRSHYSTRPENATDAATIAVDASADQQWMAITQFEPMSARLAFPCFDEPAMKATFQVSLTADSTYTALANTPVESSVVNNVVAGDSGSIATTTTTFKRTPRMSTYLVAYIVSKLESITTTTTRGLIVSVWAQPKDLAQATLALDKSAKILDYYESYYGVEFPLEKVDMVAVPDFAAGAMENWGLVTYRDSGLLYNPATTSPASLEYIVIVIAHELAHQWFGNLVTMNFWTDLWLNEGFATYVEYLGANHTDPGFQLPQKFYLETVSRALSYDASKFTHAISAREEDVALPAGVEQIFDDVSYAKGSSLIRMVQTWLDAKSAASGVVLADPSTSTTTYFQRGLQRYLKRQAFGNARRTDLWMALEEEGVKAGWLQKGTVVNMMATWSDLIGYPVVAVTSDDSGRTVLKQNRFLSRVNETAATESTPLWTIPVSYGLLAPTSRTPWSSEFLFNSSTIPLAFPSSYDAVAVATSCNDVLKVNLGQNGFYRVQYSDAHLDRMVQCLQRGGKDDVAADIAAAPWMPSEDMSGFVDDTFQLALAGRYPVTAALDLMSVVAAQDDYSVWQLGLGFISTMSTYAELEPYYAMFVDYVKTKVLADKLQRVGWGMDARDAADHSTKLLRGSLIAVAVKLNDAATVSKALEIFASIRDNSESSLNLDAAILGPVYSAAVEYGGPEAYAWMKRRHELTHDIAEKKRALYALAATKEETLIAETLAYSISPAVRAQDAASLIRLIARHSVTGRMLTWDFIRAQWPAFMERYGTGSSQFKSLLSTLAALAPTRETLRGVEKWTGDKWEMGKVSVAIGVEEGLHRLEWVPRVRGDVERWLGAAV